MAKYVAETAKRIAMISIVAPSEHLPALADAIVRVARSFDAPDLCITVIESTAEHLEEFEILKGIKS